MNGLSELSFFRTVGWALLHSLWQGAFLALLAAVALRAARNRSAELRYAIAAGALGLLVLAFFSTVAGAWPSGDPLPGGGVVMAVSDRTGTDLGSWMSRLLAFLMPTLPWLVWGWAAGMSLKLLRMGWSVGWIYGPCLSSIKPAPPEWLERFDRLRIRNRMSSSVRLVLSDRVDSLLVLGWLKPVVIIPAAALMALPPEGLEALLVHELAHIRRSDFLANLVQTLAEAMLFYHPAVWWLSQRIRQEREHCCDDAAVHTCGDPILYASALVRLEELRNRSNLIPDLAPAASGGKLMFRIQRILRAPISTVPPTPSFTVLPALLLTTTLGFTSLVASEVARFVAVDAKPVVMDYSKVKVRHQPPAPAYPAEAKAQRIQGTVVVAVTVDTKGKVIAAKAISGPPELHACAVDYARTWEFHPVKVKGEPVPAEFNLTMPFRLK